MSAAPIIVSPDAPAAGVARTDLFVSTALDFWSTDQGGAFARDVQIDDTAYRRLDPEYYAWLRSRMVLAKRAATAGNLDSTAFEGLRLQFNAVHEWAVQHFGEQLLLATMRALCVADYRPPTAEADPTVGAPRSAGDRVSPEATALVDAIRDCALSLGWKHDQLYNVGNNVFDPQRGLVCYLKPGCTIGEVTAQSIEIIYSAPSEVRHRFYNLDAEQPWIKRPGEPKK